ncbi:TetR/AcrR family transcriptional regulator [Niveispirillum fermenti]|uniref:TetR/AcrR family transcriptional regulator n=1 Tax=Niveispirillum fermenti TaxID=1233113 RepID=UPI003A8A9C3C
MDESTSNLTDLEPEGFARPDAGLQQRRSAETRIAILEATIDCLAEFGYARTTTLLVASKARASRGAMLHHYPTKQALIEATIEYAFYQRMKNFMKKVTSLTDEQRVYDNAAIQLSWQQYQSREYKAYLELHVAARTDPELREMFLPRARLYDRIWRDEVCRAFPEWNHDIELLHRASEFTRAALEGLMLNVDIWDDPDAEKFVVELVSTTLLMLRDGRIPFKKPVEAPPPPARKPRKAAAKPAAKKA